VTHKASGHFRNKNREHLKDKINQLATNSMNKNIRDLYRGINKLKRCYQPRNNLVKDENVDLHQLSIDFKKVYNSVWRKVLYNILKESGVLMIV
jgi:hypothetical protein